VNDPANHSRRDRSGFRILLLMWLMYGGYYVNRLNLAPVIPLIMADLKLSHAQVGLVSASFFAFYAAFQFPAGFLSDLWGPKKLITFGGAIAAAANLLFAGGSGILGLIGCQGLNGFGQAGGFGPSVKLVNSWFPETQRARVLGLYVTSVSVFTLITYAAAGYVGRAFGWRVVFWSAPIVMGVLLLLFWFFVSDHPGADGRPIRSISSGADGRHFSRKRDRIRTLVRHRDVLLSCGGFFCLSYIAYCILVWSTSYLHETHDLAVDRAALMAGVYPAIGIFARPLGGYLSDVTFGGRRRPLMLLGFACIALAALSLSGVSRIEHAILLIGVIGFFEQLIATQFFALELDLLPPELAGGGAGLIEAVGHMGSMTAMFLTGLMVDLSGSYRPVFWVLSTLAAVGFILVGSIRGDKALTDHHRGPSRP